MTKYLILTVLLITMTAFSQAPTLPPIEPGVPLELAKWRAAHYSDVRYKLNLTLEKMSPVLKGTIEIRVNVSEPPASAGGQSAGSQTPPIILDWRRIRGHEDKSTISNVTVNGRIALFGRPQYVKDGISRYYAEINEHLVFYDNVVIGENVIKLDFTSPILPSGSAITRYVDKEDGSEYLYSLFVPSDASTAFPVFDQPDIKARFEVNFKRPSDWTVISNALGEDSETSSSYKPREYESNFVETRPISTYVFAFAVGPFERFWLPKETNKDVRPELKEAFNKWLNNDISVSLSGEDAARMEKEKNARLSKGFPPDSEYFQHIYVRRSQAAKFKPHAAEVFRLNREAIKYFEEYFDYKFPFAKYDLVLIPEFPFGGMEHAGATFLRESSIIFPQEPTRNDHISRALLIFHEASHQWFGDTVTMRWFDDLWLKEGFATFTAYKAMERIMPEMIAWKVFYERVKQAAYQTDSTKGTTPIYQEIPNLSAAKSAYGNIVYNKAPAFLRQAEFYLGEDKFKTAVRAFLKKHEFGNAGWEDLVREFELASTRDLGSWARTWVQQPGLPTFVLKRGGMSVDFVDGSANSITTLRIEHRGGLNELIRWSEALKYLVISADGERITGSGFTEQPFYQYGVWDGKPVGTSKDFDFVFPNYQDYGYGIFLLDEKSREYVLKNIQNEKDPFLRSMMWGALWDSVREGELDPREYVELVVKVLQKPAREQGLNAQAGSKALPDAQASATDDESTTALLLSRVGTAMNYYLSEPPPSGGGQSGRSPNWPAADAAGSDLLPRVEDMLIERMQNAETLGQRITYYRAFLNIASSERARGVLKAMLSEPPASAGGQSDERENHPVGEAPTPLLRKEGSQKDGRTLAVPAIPLKTKDRFDIVTRLLILGDPDAQKLLAELEKTETSDDAKRYAYAARAGIATAENKAKYWNDFVNNKEISESWIEAAFGPWNSIRHSELTLPYLQKALQELPNHKRNRKIFFVNGWLGAFIGGQRSEEALATINKFLADNPSLDRDLRLKILENADIIERAVKIRSKFTR
ncbi:MAG: ERAP1-like C-terminal domain-containing protein [Acidobacteria bacterium]|nr:ERAP1-like C-terminal domain-containing protein [Acidobacteriota bacterium]